MCLTARGRFFVNTRSIGTVMALVLSRAEAAIQRLELREERGGKEQAS